jgi:zinc transport system permease protein
MTDFLNYDFMRNALLAGILSSIACGIIGTLVVINRLSSLSGGIAHTAYGGLGLSVFFKLPLLLGAMIFSLMSTFIMGYISSEKKERSDTLIGVIWAMGMAFGIIMIDLSKGYYADILSFLFGSILAVSNNSIIFLLIIDILCVLTITLFYKEIIAFSYDEEFAQICGIRVKLLYYFLLVLITFCIIGLIRIVGLILVIALFTIPPSIAELFTNKIKNIIIYSTILGIFFTIFGLIVSYYLNLTAGATIILILGISYFCSFCGKKIICKK